MVRRALLLAVLLSTFAGTTAARADDTDLAIEHEGTTDEDPKYEAFVREGLATMPATVRRTVVKAGYRVVLTPNITFAEPGMAMVTRFGNLKPGDAAVAGLTQGKKHRILLAEQVEKPDGTLRPTGRGTVGAIRHEMGHALDGALGQYSHKGLFKAAHEQDVAAMTPEMREKHRYLISGPTKGGPVTASAAGAGEAFADMVRIATTPAAKRDKRDLELFAIFPRCHGVVGMLDEGLRKE